MQNRRTAQIDLVKLSLFILKRIWIVAICAVIGFGAMYWYVSRSRVDTYTASGTMYVYNGNPNLVNYGYTNTSDLSSAVRLIDTYTIVMKSNKVMDVVSERLASAYPGITPGYLRGTLSMRSVSETGVVEVVCRTNDGQKSADICNMVLDVAPAEIIRVVSAGNIEVVDYATVPLRADSRNETRRAMTGALAGAVLAAGILVLLFLLDRKIKDTDDLTNNFTPPVLSSIQRTKSGDSNPSEFLLKDSSSMTVLEHYAKLRMNLLYTLVGKESHTVVVTSAISGEGKSTITANLAISCAMSGKHVLLVDADLRRATQRDIFEYDRKLPGLSEVLIKTCSLDDAIRKSEREMLDLLPAGHLPPNPAELLSSKDMTDVLQELEKRYDLVLIDMPPINIVSDPLVVSSHVAGCLFVVRQDYSDQREVRKALKAAELTDMKVLGFVFYGEKINQGSYYSRRYYNKYYNSYYHSSDHRKHEDAQEHEHHHVNHKGAENK